jgi:hypothetical protein
MRRSAAVIKALNNRMMRVEGTNDQNRTLRVVQRLSTLDLHTRTDLESPLHRNGL